MKNELTFSKWDFQMVNETMQKWNENQKNNETSLHIHYDDSTKNDKIPINVSKDVEKLELANTIGRNAK